jgi:hypothetical protein
MSTKTMMETRKKTASSVISSFGFLPQRRVTQPQHAEKLQTPKDGSQYDTIGQQGVQVTQISEPLIQKKSALSGAFQDVFIQRKCSEYEEDEEKTLQTKATPNQAEHFSVPPIVHEMLRSPGQPLDPATSASMETLFGYNFSRVRVHTDAKAAESARAVNAQAYTIGHDIAFGLRQYAPRTPEGKKLLAHELRHVVEQYGAVQGSCNTRPVAVQCQAATPVRRPPFDDLAADLRNVLEASFTERKFGCPRGIDAANCFNRLNAGARIILTSLYNRLSRFGLWSHVLYTGGIWTNGMGGAHFTVKDRLSFFSSLLASGRFCVDTAVGGMLHRGATSVREISTGDSLHLILSSGDGVSAHIDAISPVAGRQEGGLCRYEPTAAAAHIGREVVPLAIPGLQIFPEPRPTFGLPERETPPPEFIRFEFRFRGL